MRATCSVPSPATYWSASRLEAHNRSLKPGVKSRISRGVLREGLRVEPICRGRAVDPVRVALAFPAGGEQRPRPAAVGRRDAAPPDQPSESTPLVLGTAPVWTARRRPEQLGPEGRAQPEVIRAI